MPPPLVLSSYSLGTAVPFADRVAAAAAAGFQGIGLRVENWWAARADGLDLSTLAQLASAAGVPVREVEYLTGWGDANRTAPERAREADIFELAAGCGVRHVNAGLLEKHSPATVAKAFEDLCDRAGDLTVALEFMPYSGIPDLASAWQVVAESERGNAGLLVDLWHWARAGVEIAALTDIPAERIVSVQLSDVCEQPLPELRQESLGHRLPPGQGWGNAVGVLRALSEHGVNPEVLAVEVISDDLLAGGIERAAQTDHDAAVNVLQQAGWRSGTW